MRPTGLSGNAVNDDRGSGKAENPGWNLDKWKFLPLSNRTLDEYPDVKWYVFVETDTFFLWQTLLVCLSKLDWTKPYYMGSQNNIGLVEFAHGGSGWVVSRPALEKVVAHFQANKKEWEDFTDGHWAGDCVLGKAFKDSGSPLTRTWPIIQRDPVGNMNYDHERLTTSYHHMSSSAIQDLWDFEQGWIADIENVRDLTCRSVCDNSTDTLQQHHTNYLRHKDVFNLYVLPQVKSSSSSGLADWDNHCKDDQGPAESLGECRVRCEEDTACVQYAVNTEGRCLTTSRPNSGEASLGVRSGWILERMQRFYNEADECPDEGWIFS